MKKLRMYVYVLVLLIIMALVAISGLLSINFNNGWGVLLFIFGSLSAFVSLFFPIRYCINGIKEARKNRPVTILHKVIKKL